MDLFIIRPLSSVAGDTADFPNRKKQTQNIRQNEKTKEYVPNEKNRTKPQQETIMACTGLEKREKTLNTEI